MPEARPPVPIYVLDRIVSVIAKPGEEWWEIPCASKKAYVCGENMKEVVEGLKLYARLGDGPLLTSSLAIRMSAGARRIFESKLGIDPDGPIGSDLRAHAVVEVAEEQGVTTIVLSVRRSSLPIRLQRTLIYYLVYDATDRSLSMFQIPRGEGVCTRKPIVPKRTDGSDYKLVLLGREVRLSSHKDGAAVPSKFKSLDFPMAEHKDVFWVGSLSLSAGAAVPSKLKSMDFPTGEHKDVFWVGSLSSSDGAATTSKFKSMDFPTGEIHKPFKVDVAFSFQGKAFWGDLEQGLVYCDLQTSGESDMDFGFVKLPCECKVEVDVETGEPLLPMRNTRTMGCAGDSIWFVCIDIPSHYSNAVVCIWELALPGEQLNGKRKEVEWKTYDKVPAKALWELPCFKESGLPAAPFQYPILTAEGALCFVLVDQIRFPRNECPLVDHFCSFDMRHKRLLWHGLVHNYPITDSIVMYPSSSFLQMKQAPCNMSFAEDHPDAGLEAMAGGER